MGLHRSLVLCLLVCLIAAAPAGAATFTSSSISSPVNGTELFFNGDNGSGNVTVAGTVTPAITATNGGDLVCYTLGDTKATLVSTTKAVPIARGRFAINVSLLPIAGFACRLAIIPTGSSKFGQAAAPYQGPAVSVSDQFSHSLSGSLFGYYILSGSLDWAFAMQSAGECAVHASYATDSQTLGSFTLFGLDSGTVGVACLPASSGVSDPTGTRSSLQIDGMNAYLPGAIPSLTTQPGFIPLTYGTLFNPAHDAGGIAETDAPMICDAPATFPPTTSTCPSLHDSGIRLEQTTVLLPQAQVVRVTQRFTSVDGRPHSIDALFGQSVSAPSAGESPGFQFPGQTSFATHARPDSFTQFPAGPSSIIAISNNGGFLPATSNPIGAITYSRPPASADFITPSGAQTATMLMHYVDSIPAGGSVVYDWSFSQASSSVSLQSLEEIERDRFGNPSVTITNPPNRAVMTHGQVRIQGRVSDSVRITSLNVGGRGVIVQPGGLFGVTLNLRPGANTILATATNLAGNKGNASVTVTYKLTQCRVPRLHGSTLKAAKRKLASAGCRVGKLKRVHSRTVHKGRVVSTNPAAGSRHSHGWRVGVVLSRGR